MQIREGELYLSSEDIKLDDSVSTSGYIRDGHIGIEEADIFLVDQLIDIQEPLEALVQGGQNVGERMAPSEQRDHPQHFNIRIVLYAAVWLMMWKLFLLSGGARRS